MCTQFCQLPVCEDYIALLLLNIGETCEWLADSVNLTWFISVVCICTRASKVQDHSPRSSTDLYFNESELADLEAPRFVYLRTENFFSTLTRCTCRGICDDVIVLKTFFMHSLGGAWYRPIVYMAFSYKEVIYWIVTAMIVRLIYCII
jgi:hypothetical protein